MGLDGAEPAPYESALPVQEVERIRAWHEKAYADRRELGEMTFDYLGLSLVVPPSVQLITPMSRR